GGWAGTATSSIPQARARGAAPRVAIGIAKRAARSAASTWTRTRRCRSRRAIPGGEPSSRLLREAPRDPLDAIHELAEVDRLEHEVAHAEHLEAPAVVGADATAHHHHARAVAAGERAKPRERAHAVEVGHVEVEQHQIRRLDRRAIDGFLAGS